MDTTTTTGYNILDCMKYLDENGPSDEWDEWDSTTFRVETPDSQLECMTHLDKKDDRPKLKIYPTKLDIQAKKEDPNTECSLCNINRNKVQFKPCNHTLCIGCSNTIISEHEYDTTCPFCRGNVKKNVLLTN